MTLSIVTYISQKEHNSEKKLALKSILYKCSVVQLKC